MKRPTIPEITEGIGFLFFIGGVALFSEALALVFVGIGFMAWGLTKELTS